MVINEAWEDEAVRRIYRCVGSGVWRVECGVWSVDNINDDAVFDDDRTIERPTFIDDRSTFDDCSHALISGADWSKDWELA